jgi:hypothetical protein
MSKNDETSRPPVDRPIPTHYPTRDHIREDRGHGIGDSAPEPEPEAAGSRDMSKVEKKES